MKSVNYYVRHVYSAAKMKRLQSNVYSTSRLHRRPDEPRVAKLLSHFADKTCSPEVPIVHPLHTVCVNQL